jgi:hypothetical protein
MRRDGGNGSRSCANAHLRDDVTVAKMRHPAVGDYADFLWVVFVVWGFFPSSCQRASVISTP